MKYNLIWNKLSKEDYERLMDMVNNGMELGDDFIGCVEKGSLKFDFVYREIDTDDFLLCVDFYGLDDDSGYGKTDSGKSYNFFDGFDVKVDKLKSLKSYEDFKNYFDKEITETVLENDNIKNQFFVPYDDWGEKDK